MPASGPRRILFVLSDGSHSLRIRRPARGTGRGHPGHTLVTAVRRRRHELATLKMVGFVPRQVAATVAWLATSLVVVALAVGLPLGVAAGRWGWTVVADGIGTPAAPVTPVLAVALAIPLTLLVTNALAALPARRAARTRPAVALRAE